MAYYVLSDTGERFGPADEATLRQWAAEGRLTSTTQIEDDSGFRFPAGSASWLSEVIAPPVTNWAEAPGRTVYPRAGSHVGPVPNEMNRAVIALVLSLLFCNCMLPFTIYAVICANKVDMLVRLGDVNLALSNSDKARRISNISFGFSIAGAIFVVGYMVFALFFAAAAF